MQDAKNIVQQRRRRIRADEFSMKLETNKAESHKEIEEAKQEVAASHEEVINLHNMLEQKHGQWIEQLEHNV